MIIRRYMPPLYAAVGVALAVFVVGTASLNAQMQCRGGTIVFYPDGPVKSCEIEGVHRLRMEPGWIKCASGHVMTRHPNGRLESCTLAEAASFDPQSCPAGSRITFNDDRGFDACE